jgi:hypothetical protein
MLLGVVIHVFTDHKHMIIDTLKMQRVSRWHTKLKSFTHTTLHQGPLQYFSQQPFMAPLLSYTGSDHRGEETH